MLVPVFFHFVIYMVNRKIQITYLALTRFQLNSTAIKFFLHFYHVLHEDENPREGKRIARTLREKERENFIFIFKYCSRSQCLSLVFRNKLHFTILQGAIQFFLLCNNLILILFALSKREFS